MNQDSLEQSVTWVNHLAPGVPVGIVELLHLRNDLGVSSAD